LVATISRFCIIEAASGVGDSALDEPAWGQLIRVGSALLLALPLWALASPSLAQPSIWEAAKDPRAAKAFKLERIADRNRVSPDPSIDEGQLEEKLNEQAAMMLLMAGGEQLGS